MKNSFRNAILSVLFLALLANAEEPDYQKNLRVMAYWHPISFFYGAACNMFMLNSTIEVPLSLSNSVVIQPAVWLGTSDGEILNVEYEKLIRVGSGIGMRRYATDRGYGFYLQAMANAYFIHAKKIDGSEMPIWKKDVMGAVGELMLYMGLSHKWQRVSFFYEVGMGFGFDGTETEQVGYINKLATSVNIGIGIPL